MSLSLNLEVLVSASWALLALYLLVFEDPALPPPMFLLLFKDLFTFLLTNLCVQCSAFMYSCMPKEGTKSYSWWLCATICGGWKLNSGPLGKPSLQPQSRLFLGQVLAGKHCGRFIRKVLLGLRHLNTWSLGGGAIYGYGKMQTCWRSYITGCPTALATSSSHWILACWRRRVAS